jgi:hypothetical protein
MRRLVLIVLCAGCGSGSGSGTPPDAATLTDTYPDEILLNGGFETLDPTGFATEWNNIDTNPDGDISVVTDPHRFGSHALQWQIDAVDGWEYFVMQTGIPGTALEAGKTYELSGAYMFDHLGDIDFTYAVRGQGGTDPSYDDLSDRTVIASQVNAWEPFRYEIAIPPGTALPANWEVVIDVLKFTAEPLTVSLDGLSLHEKPHSP